MQSDGTLWAHSMSDAERSIRGVEAQIRFETDAIQRGVNRYQAVLRDSTLDTTPPGMSAIRDIMPALDRAIAEAQAEAQESIANAKQGRQPEWWWIIQHLAADKLAFLTCRAALASIPRERDLGAAKTITALALGIANDLRVQMDFERWAAQEKEERKAAKRRGEERADLLIALKSRCKGKAVDAQAWRRWQKKLKMTRDAPWPTEAKVQIGTKLIELLTKHGGGWFEVALVPDRGKTERRLILTELALRAISDINQRIEVAKPLLMPMIHPPKPWRWEAKEAAQ